jgi:Asp/Glu/hydantoin racemase
MTRRVALIHAVTVAMQPVEDAFRRIWPEAERSNLLDDSLSIDREREGSLTPAMAARIETLAAYAEGTGAAGILFTCSAFGPAIAAAARARPHMPVLKPNEAMFEAAFRHGRRIGMLATFQPSVASMEEEFYEMARAGGHAAEIETVCVPDAIAALRQGDVFTHNRLVAAAARRLEGSDAILLAHFSTARAEDDVRATVDCPVLTSPGSAVARLKAALHG